MHDLNRRTFIIPKIPGHLRISRPVSIRQGYLSAGDKSEVSIYQKGRRYYQLIRCGSGLHVKVRLFRKQFDKLWEATASNRLFSIRVKTLIDGHHAEIDTYQHELDGLILLSIKFGSEDRSHAFEAPTWLGPEVTYCSSFQRRCLVENKISLTSLPRHSDHDKGDFCIGAIPFFFENNQLKIVTITSRKKRKIIFPKGQPEKKLTGARVALLEAMEEAGIKGRIIGHPMLVIVNSKNPYQVLYPVAVDELMDRWPEFDERDRYIMNYEDALNDSECGRIQQSLMLLRQLGLPVHQGLPSE